MYWGASVEAQAPFYFLPKDAGLKGAVFADAGSLWDYKGPTIWSVTGETLTPAPNFGAIRASVGVGLIWNSPFGPLRFDYSFPLLKQSYDRVQRSASAAAPNSSARVHAIPVYDRRLRRRWQNAARMA